MKTFAVIGNPISHSLSPQMQNYAISKLKIEAMYLRYLLEDGNRLKEKFLKLKLDGANITLPYKEFAYNLVDEVRGDAIGMKSVNTVVLEDGRLIGYNSDGFGFMKSIEEFEAKNILLLGAGGTARSIAYILKSNEIDVTILNRSKERLSYFKEFKVATFEDFNSFEDFDLVVNSTSAGLKDSYLPAPIDILNRVFERGANAFDVIYGKKTPFLELATAHNRKIKDGASMLIYQGAMSLNLFLNSQFSVEEIAKLLRDGLSKEALL